MKKLVSLVMTIAILLSLSQAAWAAEEVPEIGNVKKSAVGKHPKSERLGSTGQAACCARIHSRYFTGGNPSGLRV